MTDDSGARPEEDGDSELTRSDVAEDEEPGDTHERLWVVGEFLPAPTPVHDRIVVAAAVVTVLGAVGFAAGLLSGASATVYGTALGVALLALALGVRRYYIAAYPELEALEPRTIPEAETDAPLTEVTPLGRRTALQRLLVAAAAVLGVSLATPVSSLGPTPGNALRTTQWTRGSRLVDTDGRPYRPDDLEPGSVATVWPARAVEEERSTAVLLGLSGEPRPPTNMDWVVDDRVVAYSKICTHAACPVGLFRERDDALFCPCHQATFDASRGAEPTFGPAARALPQLPLGVDEDGYLIALGDFPEQIGPWFGGKFDQ